MSKLKAGLLAGLALVFVLLWMHPGGSPAPIISAGLDVLPGQEEDFQRVTGPQPLHFPSDFGPHPAYQTEWWYFTGNVRTAEGRKFGYELTFFRRGLQRDAQPTSGASSWRTGQVYLAHFALSDAAGKEFHAFERMERGGVTLAGASGDPAFQVWLHDWRVEQTSVNTFHLHARQDGLDLSLDLDALKDPVLQGDQGYSQKGADVGNASIYVSLTRLKSKGTLTLDGSSYQVDGLSWMDHEYGTSALAPGQTGWDWFSIQLDDGSELMVYQIRSSQGQIDPYSHGMLIRPDGSTLSLQSSNFQIHPAGQWTSPHSGAVYPASWQVDVPGTNLSLRVIPILPDQELNLSFIYWEGAVDVTGILDGKNVHGSGYVELTGYAQSMAGRF
jgi:predicted secreted hydrolase